VSNIGGADLAEALSSDVQRLLFSKDQYTGANPNMTLEMHQRIRTSLVKKASLCLVRLFRTNKEIISLDKQFVDKIGSLLQENDVGVLTSVMSLVLSITSSSPGHFEPLLSNVIGILSRLVVDKSCPHDYQYYRIPTPWLSVKCLKYLQYYKMPEGKKWETLNDILSKILTKSDNYMETSNKSNAENSILMEAINLIIGFGADAPAPLKEHSATILGRFIAMKVGDHK
jgi:AP-2 complex subunit alpha